MSLRLQNENDVRDRKATTSKQALPVQATAQVKPLTVCEQNVECPPRKTSKELKASGARIAVRAEAEKSQPEGRLDHPCPLSNVEDIDADDDEYLEFCPDYVKPIYDHLFEAEVKHPVKADYLRRHPELSPRMRMCLIEWLLTLQNRFSLIQDTLLMSISIMDRMLSESSVKITRANFQLLGATCLWVAAKIEEMYLPSVGDFVYMCADTYTALQFREMESRILITLGFEFSKPLSSHFLRRFSKAGGGDLRTHCAAKYLIELSLYCYALVDCRPSLIAASALFVAGKATKEVTWDETVQFYSRYKAEKLKRVALRMAAMAVDVEPYLRTTRNKYMREKFYLVPQLFKRELLKELFPTE